MRTITIPKDCNVIVTEVVDGLRREALRLLALAKYLEEAAYTDPWWRDPKYAAVRLPLLASIAGKFDGKKEGDVVELTDEEFEALRPRALQSEKPVGSHVAIALLPFFEAIAGAKVKKPPEEEKKAE